MQLAGVDAQRSPDRAADDRVQLTRAVEQIRSLDVCAGRAILEVDGVRTPVEAEL